MMKSKTVFFVFLIFGTLMNGCGDSAEVSGDEEIVNAVRNEHFNQSHFLFGSDTDFKSKTIGEAFDNFFESPKWKGFVSNKGDKIAEFSGKAEFTGDKVVVEFQFAIISDDSFVVKYFGMDGESAPQVLGEGLIEKIFE